jgi:RNA polymerase sigma factor (sigma-70 family)
MSEDREHPTPEDQGLLAGFVAGDDVACKKVVDWARDIVRFRPYGIPRHEHEDVVQESVGMVWRACSKPDFALRTGLRALTRRVVLARCVDQLRRMRPSVPIEPEMADSRPGPEQQLARRQQWAHVQRVLQQLDESCRAIIRLHFLDEVPYSELAGRLGLATPTVRVRMFYCMKEVRRLLDLEALERPRDHS